MLSSPIIIFYSFLVLVVFVIGVAPTGLWKRFGGSMTGAVTRARHDRAAGHFARATANTPFTADIDYVPIGIAFAFDRTRALLFVGEDDSDTAAEALVPVAAFRGKATGVITGGLIDENYIDLFPADPAQKKWRISCAEDTASAYAIARLLNSLGVPAA